MGTINYKRSEIITLGYNTDNQIDEDFDEEDIQLQQEFDYEVSEEIVNKYTFKWFNVKIQYGYYDGYYLDLDKEYDINSFLEDYERDEIKEEINDLEELLNELVKNSQMNICYPFWCTGWEDYDNSLIKINEAINKLRKELR